MRYYLLLNDETYWILPRANVSILAAAYAQISTVIASIDSDSETLAVKHLMAKAYDDYKEKLKNMNGKKTEEERKKTGNTITIRY